MSKSRDSVEDLRTIDTVTATANAALPKAGGALTGAVTTNSTFDGVDIATRDGVLTSTTATAAAALPKAGGTMTGDISHGDNVKAKFGAGDDLQIYHDGGNSRIVDSGTGILTIQASSQLSIYNADGSQSSADFVNDGKVGLRYSGAEKLATTSTGVDVTGILYVNGDATGGRITGDGSGGLDLQDGNGRQTFKIMSPASGSSQSMTLNASGNLGIGTSSPTRKLTVYDTDAYLALQNPTTGSAAGDGFQLQLVGNDVYQWNYEAGNLIVGNNNAERMRISATGNVGIGTSSPSQSWTGGSAHVVQIEGGGSQITALRINESGDTNGDLQLVSGASNEVGIYNFNNGAMRFGTNGTEAMRINSSGSVGIGTSSPSDKAHIAGGGLIVDKTNNGYSGARFHDDSGGDYNSYIDLGRDQSGARLTIRRGGRVQGTTPWTNATPTPIVSFANGGIAFGTDTAAANTLDDYEEGTFVPILKGSTNAGSFSTDNSHYGRYTKIGDICSLSFVISGTLSGATGTYTHFNLPFTVKAGTAATGTFSYVLTPNLNHLDFSCYVSPGQTLGYFLIKTGNAATPVYPAPSSFMPAGVQIYGTVTYTVA